LGAARPPFYQSGLTEDEAITRANATIFGLAASIFTKDVDRAQRVARAIKAGTVWTNTWESSMTRRTPLGLSTNFLPNECAHGQGAVSANVGMFQVKADDARVVPVKRQSAPKQVRPVQGQGGHPRRHEFWL
jgi:hypothetical protein